MMSVRQPMKNGLSFSKTDHVNNITVTEIDEGFGNTRQPTQDDKALKSEKVNIL